MPYTAAHKQQTRERIVESARQLFNRRGLNDVSIDDIMQAAGLTRGGFYNHFASKDELYVEAIDAYSRCNPADRFSTVQFDPGAASEQRIQQFINAYLSREHLDDTAAQCPMIALPSDIARASAPVKHAYERVLGSMAAVFQSSDASDSHGLCRREALTLVAMCIGGMILARTLDDGRFANEIREAVRSSALQFADTAHRRAE